MFLPILLGGVTAVTLYLLIWNPLYEKEAARVAPAPVAPEFRLHMTMYAAPVYAASFFWFGWTSSPSISFWAPMMAGYVMGFGISWIFVSASPPTTLSVASDVVHVAWLPQLHHRHILDDCRFGIGRQYDNKICVWRGVPAVCHTDVRRAWRALGIVLARLSGHSHDPHSFCVHQVGIYPPGKVQVCADEGVTACANEGVGFVLSLKNTLW